jgi:hypothetical protein
MSHIGEIRPQTAEDAQEDCLSPGQIASASRLYTYTNNDPINSTDPTGHACGTCYNPPPQPQPTGPGHWVTSCSSTSCGEHGDGVMQTIWVPTAGGSLVGGGVSTDTRQGNGGAVSVSGLGGPVSAAPTFMGQMSAGSFPVGPSDIPVKALADPAGYAQDQQNAAAAEQKFQAAGAAIGGTISGTGSYMTDVGGVVAPVNPPLGAGLVFGGLGMQAYSAATFGGTSFRDGVAISTSAILGGMLGPVVGESATRGFAIGVGADVVGQAVAAAVAGGW